jgi:hypothetical protein
MRIGLIDVDGHNFPNLALMKISAYHKQRGDSVEWWMGLRKYDRVYKSKVFTFTPDVETAIQADEVIQGGTGYDLKTTLLPEIESLCPDYSLYSITNTAYGYLTRGCPRNCKFCIASQKEGKQSRKVADLSGFWTGQKHIKLLDPNMLAAPEGDSLLEQIADSGAWVDFTQGLDVRLMDKDRAALIKRCKVKIIHFAWDNPREDLTEQFHRVKEWVGLDRRKMAVYVLTNFNSTREENLNRIYILRELGFDPYVMIYEKDTAPRETRLLQRWVNNKIIFRTCKRFEDYNPALG